MRFQTIQLRLLCGLLIAPSVWADSAEDKIAAIRAGFVEIGRREIAWSQASRDQRHQLPSGYEACLPLMKAHPEILKEAVDRGIREGSFEERIGALETYQIAISPTEQRLIKRPEYQALLMDLLKQDDLQSIAYTGTIISALSLYRSREVVLAQLDAAARARDPQIRERLVVSAASLLHLDVPIYKQTTPLAKERILADLESWLNRNRDRIRFNKEGQPYLGGGEVREGRVELTPEDRERIRKDPVCVLKLIRVMMNGEEENGARELNTQCGEALLGVDGASLIRKAEGIAGTGGPSLDFQAAMAAARGKYATMDAVQLAIAYVAAYVTDPEARKLALETIDDLGVEDMGRVLKGEPKEVRKKAKELANDVPKSTDDD